jgi:hypothetical protein
VIVDVPERVNPADETPLEEPIVTAKQAGMQVRSVYADRGFGKGAADQALARQRIRDPVIPRQQRPAAIEHTRAWKRRYRYRNGIEGRVSQLKRKGLARTRLRGLPGARTWVGTIALAPQPPSHGSARLRKAAIRGPPRASALARNPSAPRSGFFRWK